MSNKRWEEDMELTQTRSLNRMILLTASSIACSEELSEL